MPTPDLGTGITLNFATSGFTACVTNVSHSGWERAAIDVTCMTDTEKQFIPGDLVDYGSLSFDIFFDPNDDVPVGQASETITVTFATRGSQTTAANWQFTGFATSFEWSAPLEDAMTGTLTVKVDGPITFNDAA